MEEDNSRQRKGISCRSLSCFFLLSVFLCLFISFLILISKPPVVWDGIVSFNNKDAYLDYETEYNLEESRKHVEEQIQNIGENTINLEEDHLTVLARSSFPELKDLTIDMEEGEMRIYWSIEQIKTEAPLIGYAEIRKNNDNELYVEQLGTPRFRLPRSLNETISTAALAIFSFGEEKASENNLLYKIISANGDVEIKDVRFLDDSLELIVNVDVNLYD